MTGIALLEPDDEFERFSSQFTNLGIDDDRANALGRIFVRESKDPLSVLERSDEDWDLISGVVDDLAALLPNENVLPSEPDFLEFDSPSVSGNLLGTDPELDRILWGVPWEGEL
ncbi:hypothetical protein [Egbenema bharatensis]|uniref:hypothetical protein n=1 Tax=Egbenema bharatensis TaxID=3463334 RepID=UPI003A8773D9